mmetsp:Transcript_84216/g.239082  ORF Transcript_84216/g.239082 Transcript_84216/m.239082 type:complete len:253 (-) Transcript_84216:160-918(-)
MPPSIFLCICNDALTRLSASSARQFATRFRFRRSADSCAATACSSSRVDGAWDGGTVRASAASAGASSPDSTIVTGPLRPQTVLSATSDTLTRNTQVPLWSSPCPYPNILAASSASSSETLPLPAPLPAPAPPPAPCIPACRAFRKRLPSATGITQVRRPVLGVRAASTTTSAPPHLERVEPSMVSRWPSNTTDTLLMLPEVAHDTSTILDGHQKLRRRTPSRVEWTGTADLLNDIRWAGSSGEVTNSAFCC